jgi:RsiW-degrading membrane proteinase PrsW (M82 family)
MEKRRPGGEMRSAEPQDASKSELMPLSGHWRALLSKNYVVPGMLAVIAVALFSYSFNNGGIQVPAFNNDLKIQQNVTLPLFDILLGFYISLALAFVVFKMVGKPGSLKTLLSVAVIGGLLVNWNSFFFMIHHLVDFGQNGLLGDDSPWPSRLIAAIKGAGLPEEIFKCIPVAIGVFLGRTLTDRNSPLWAFRVVEPIDGILMGVGSGLGFAFVETMFQYVPNLILNIDIVNQVGAQALLDHIKQTGSVSLSDLTSSVSVGALPLEMVIVRLTSNLFAHPAWAGIFGYYVGLAVLRRSGRVRAVLTGLAIAAGMHALWDSGLPDALQTGLSLISFLMLAAVVMKAREISPHREDLVASQLLDKVSELRGGAGSQGLSQLRSHPVAPVDAYLVPRMTGMPPPIAAPGSSPAPVLRNSSGSTPAPGSNPNSTSSPAGYQAPGMSGAGQVSGQSGFAATSSASVGKIVEIRPMLHLNGTSLPIEAAQKIFQNQVPGSVATAGDGVIGEIVAHPQDPALLGLMNRSEQTWDVLTAKGEQRQLQPGRSIRLAPGTRITLNGLVAQVI